MILQSRDVLKYDDMKNNSALVRYARSREFANAISSRDRNLEGTRMPPAFPIPILCYIIYEATQKMNMNAREGR